MAKLPENKQKLALSFARNGEITKNELNATRGMVLDLDLVRPDPNVVVQKGNVKLTSYLLPEEEVRKHLDSFVELYGFLRDFYGVDFEYVVNIDYDALGRVRPDGGKVLLGETGGAVVRDGKPIGSRARTGSITLPMERWPQLAAHESTHLANMSLNPVKFEDSSLNFDIEPGPFGLSEGYVSLLNEHWFDEGLAGYLGKLYQQTKAGQPIDTFRIKNYSSYTDMYNTLKNGGSVFSNRENLDSHRVGEVFLIFLQEDYGFTHEMIRNSVLRLVNTYRDSFDKDTIDRIDWRQIKSSFEEEYGQPLDDLFKKLMPGIEYNSLV